MNLKSFASTMVVELAAPGRTLQRLCKHFSHKVHASWNEEEGSVDFVIGRCALRACEQTLEIRCTANGEGELREIEQTLERHLPAMSGEPGAKLPLSWER